MIKNNKICIYLLMLLGLVLMLTSNCKKEEEIKAPVLTTAETTSITSTSATSGGNITSDGGAAITERGVCYGTTLNPDTSSNKITANETTGQYTCSLVELIPGTTYYIRAYATNSVGIAYGNVISFTTASTVPNLITKETTLTTTTTTIGGGNITSDGGAAITERGVCYGTAQSPNTGNSKITATGTIGAFTCSLVGLVPATTYYVRAYATNSVGTAYGNEISFTTYSLSSVTDIDNNYYDIITIGTQTWMKENLKTTKYSNGDPISKIEDNTLWSTQTAGAYCWYNNDETTYKDIYGALYNWYTMVDNRKLCPIGWHVPSYNEWNSLEVYIGINEGGKLKEIGTKHWLSPNTGASNTTGFTGLPGGSRLNSGEFSGIGNYGYFWSSSEFSTTLSSVRTLYSFTSSFGLGYNPLNFGYSVRCVKD